MKKRRLSQRRTRIRRAEAKKPESAPKVEKTEPIKPVKAEEKPKPASNKAKTPTNNTKPKRMTRKKAKKSRGRKVIAFVGIVAIIAGGSFGLNRLLEDNSQSSTTVVSDAKVSKSSSSKKQSAKAKKLASQKKKEEAARLKKEQARKSNWIAGNIYQLDIKTKGISGTVNKNSRNTLNLPSPSLSKKVYVVFNPDYTQKNFVSVTSLKTARQTAKSQTKFDKLVKKNANYKFDNDRLTISVPGLSWSYPMSPYNAIQLSKQGRKKVNNFFANALTNAKLNKKSNKNTFMINKQLSGKDFSNTSWDNYRATYKIRVDFNKVK